MLTVFKTVAFIIFGQEPRTKSWKTIVFFTHLLLRAIIDAVSPKRSIVKNDNNLTVRYYSKNSYQLR